MESFDTALARYVRAKNEFDELASFPRYQELLRCEKHLSYYMCLRH
jgi:hypothetical protein